MNFTPLNKAQKLLLGIAGTLILFFQLYRFAKDGIEGIGWIFSISVGTALLLPAFSLITNNDNEFPNTKRDYTSNTENRIQELFSRSISEAIILHRRLPNLIGLPQFQLNEFSNINSLMTGSWLQYCIAYTGCLSLMAELKINKNFLNSQDYKTTWQLLLNEMVKVDAKNAEEHGLVDKFNPTKSKELAIKDLSQAEAAMKKFIDRLTHRIPGADSPMVDFLMDKVGAPDAIRPNLSLHIQKFTLETLKKFVLH